MTKNIKHSTDKWNGKKKHNNKKEKKTVQQDEKLLLETPEGKAGPSGQSAGRSTGPQGVGPALQKQKEMNP